MTEKEQHHLSLLALQTEETNDIEALAALRILNKLLAKNKLSLRQIISSYFYRLSQDKQAQEKFSQEMKEKVDFANWSSDWNSLSAEMQNKFIQECKEKYNPLSAELTFGEIELYLNNLGGLLDRHVMTVYKTAIKNNIDLKTFDLIKKLNSISSS